MSNPLSRPTARFFAGFLFTAYFSLPAFWVLLGALNSFSLLLVLTVAASILGGVFFVRRPPAFFYDPLPQVHGAGLFNRAIVRFLAGFLLIVFIYVPVMWLLQFPPSSELTFLAPVIAVGIYGGLMWVRKPPAFLTKHSD